MPHPPTASLRPHAKRAGSNPEKQRGSFITPETWMAARLSAARHDAGIKRVRATNKPLARPPTASFKSRLAVPTLVIAARFTVTLSPPASLRTCARHLYSPPRHCDRARSVAGSNPEKQRGSFITPEIWMAARLAAARHDEGIKRVRTINKPLALHPHPRHCDIARSGREAIQKNNAL